MNAVLLEPGAVIGDYRIEERLPFRRWHRYRATHLSRRCSVVLCLGATYDMDASTIPRFHANMKRWASAEHPGLVLIYLRANRPRCRHACGPISVNGGAPA